MTLKNRIDRLEKTVKPWGAVTNDDTIQLVYDDSTGLRGVEMTRAEYVEYAKSKTGTVIITIMERMAQNDDSKPTD